MKIPIRNVYYLLLYAWDRIGDTEVEVAAAGHAELHDLFAHLLADSVARILARGLDRQYLTVEAAIPGIRGKLDLATTLRRNHLSNARTHCRFDELQHDVLHNQILKATLRSLMDLELDREVRRRLRRLYQKLDVISDVRITRRDFGRVQLHRNNREYAFALRLCELIHDHLMVEPGTGRATFRDFRNDPRQMGALFEEFVYNFFRIEQEEFEVSRPWIDWYDAQGSKRALDHLPRMETDIVLESSRRALVLDTKFYSDPLQGRFDQKRIISGHLYQIFSYVVNRASDRDNGLPQEGMLLYPVVDHAFAFDYHLSGHPIAVRSIDLSQPWQLIRCDLLRLLE